MKAIVVGSGAGGAVAARELAKNGFEVTILEAGKPFKPLSHKVTWLSPLRGSWLLKDECSINYVFPIVHSTGWQSGVSGRNRGQLLFACATCQSGEWSKGVVSISQRVKNLNINWDLNIENR